MHLLVERTSPSASAQRIQCCPHPEDHTIFSAVRRKILLSLTMYHKTSLESLHPPLPRQGLRLRGCLPLGGPSYVSLLRQQMMSEQCKIDQIKFNRKSIHQMPIQQWDYWQGMQLNEVTEVATTGLFAWSQKSYANSDVRALKIWSGD